MIIDNQKEGSKMDKEALTAILRNDGVIWDNDLLCLLYGCNPEKCEHRDSCTVDWTILLESSPELGKQPVHY